MYTLSLEEGGDSAKEDVDDVNGDPVDDLDQPDTGGAALSLCSRLLEVRFPVQSRG